MEKNVGDLISKFADATKIRGVADSKEDCPRIQQDINWLETWAERWQMEFNPDKYEVMRFGMSIAEGKYTVNSRALRNISIQKNLGMQIHSS